MTVRYTGGAGAVEEPVPVTNARADTAPAVAAGAVGDLGVVAAAAGVATEPSPVTVADNAGVGVDIDATTDAVSSTAVSAAQAVSAVKTGPHGPNNAAASGAEIVQVRYDLTQRIGANSAANDGPQNFTNPSNATGRKDDTMATISDQSLTASAVGALTLGYADPADKTALTITSVHLHFFYRHSPGAVASNHGLRWRHDGGAWITLVALTGAAADHRTTPRTFDITSTIAGDWNRVAGIETNCQFSSGTANQGTLEVDAVEVEIVANRTDLL